MKKIGFYICIIFMFIHFGETFSQQKVKAERFEIKRDGNAILMDLVLDVKNVDLKSQEMIILTPELLSADNLHTYKFEPVIIAGAKKKKSLDRAMKFGDIQFEQNPQMILKKEKDQNIAVSLAAPYQDWLHESRLVLNEEMKGCGCKDEGSTMSDLVAQVLPPVFDPSYQLIYIMPPAEEVKQRSETHSAHLNFQVAKYKLLEDFKNNSEVLHEVDQIVRELRNDTNLTVTEFKIIGYASPEGNTHSNMILSENRAHAFVTYLKEHYNIPASAISTDWKGEDWNGLRDIVSNLDFEDRGEVLEILNDKDVANRKRRLQQLSGGKTYQYLLQNYYPSLRRNDYTISYVARKFDVNEAKELVKIKPHHLSQNEMFLVANTYPKNSNEFKEIFDIAVRLYPDNPIAQCNAAALEIENGSYDRAIERLIVLDMPEAWNNLGVIYCHKKDFKKAEEHFRKAAEAGHKTAMENVEQYEKWMKSQQF